MKRLPLRRIACLFVFLIARESVAETVGLFPLRAVNTPPGVTEAVEATLSARLGALGHNVVTGDALEGPEPATPERPITDSMPARAVAAGCTHYIHGSLVQLGAQIDVDLNLFTSSGSLIASERAGVPGEHALPAMLQTAATRFDDAMGPPSGSELPAETPPETAQAPTPPATAKNDDVNESHFGIAFAQIIGVSKTMHTSTLFHFNGRFQFNRVLMILSTGFAFGSTEEIERGLHFGLDLAAAAYLTRTMIAPYVGAGFGMYMGSLLQRCGRDVRTGDGTYEEDNERCTDRPYIGWEGFPTVGVEFLQTRSLRVHFEGRYIIAFNAEMNWGHGPMMLVGVAF